MDPIPTDTQPEPDGHYRALFEQYVEAVFLYDARTRRVLDGNPAFVRLLGYAPEELPALSVYDVVGHPGSEVDAVHEQASRRGGAAIGRRLWRRKDGALVDVEVSVGRLEHAGRDILFGVARAAGDGASPAALPSSEARRPQARRRGRGDDGPGTARLSRREGQVLKLLAFGFSNRQIATRLKLSVKTVETFRARLYRKLGLRGRPALVRHALRAGLFAAEDPAIDV